MAGPGNAMRGLICRIFIVLAPLGGCAGTSSYTQSFYAQPGKFHFLRCQDIVQRQIGVAKREQELNSLIDRAKQGTGGTMISAVVYGPDLEQARADARQLQEAANEKNCDASFAPGRGPSGATEPVAR
jgi:hypothetical protein